MTNKLFVLTLCILVSFISQSTHCRGNDRPNVLMILVDDLKPTLGCYGDTTAITPNIDSLAARSLRFDQAYCNQAVCAPSRFTLMLGSHSTSSGLYDLGSQLRQRLADAVTLPQHFATHGGYRTESLGKVFHIGHGNNGDPESFSVPHFKEKVIEYADPKSTDGGKLTREEAYFTNQMLDRIGSLPRGAAFEAPDVDDTAYADGRVAQETVQRLKAAKQRLTNNKSPFFIAAGFVRPHLPFSAPRKYWDLYDPSTLPMPKFEELPANAPPIAGKRGGEISNYSPVPTDRTNSFDDALKRQLIHGYYASTSYVDAQIGKVLNALKELDLEENTIVVLWGDHGFHLGDHGIWTKHTNYEEATRIPLLIAAPGITAPGSTTKHLAESVDIYPTLAELANLPKPSGPQSIDGISLVPVLRNPATRLRNHAYHVYPKKKLGRALRTARHRFVQWKSLEDPNAAIDIELYDYELDPFETKNIAAESPQLVEEFEAILATYPAPVDSQGRSTSTISTRSISEGHLPKSVQALEGTSPLIAGTAFEITGDVNKHSKQGVIVAQGGREQGFAIHLVEGSLHFDIRVNGEVTQVFSPAPLPDSFQFRATLNESNIELAVNGKKVAELRSPGFIPIQPKDPLSIGRDVLSAAGNYEAPNECKELSLGSLTISVLPASPEFPSNNPKKPAPAMPRPSEIERRPKPTMDAETIRLGLKTHDRALFIKSGWIRDPYITLGPDGYYYLTGTQAREDDPREFTDPYNKGLGDDSIVGNQVRVWKSPDLIDWDYVGAIYSVSDTHAARTKAFQPEPLIWAPELHWIGKRWALVHCPQKHASLAVSQNRSLQGPWTHPMQERFGQRHDPSLFLDDDGTRYLLWGNTWLARLNNDLEDYASEPIRLDPAGSRPGPSGNEINRIGHEGATMLKIGNKYVHIGTAWSTDRMRSGSYNLYYCVAENIAGPYGPRQFAGRFLGHGTPFQDRDGQWWCTAFFNGDVPPLPREGIQQRDLRDTAQTINEQGVTIVPMDFYVELNDAVVFRAKDPDYSTPGPDEAQKFF